MPTQTRDVSPGNHGRQVKTAEGVLLDVPLGWSLLAPGDAALSRRVKTEGPSWTVKEKRGRKIFSRGIWAPHERIERLRAELALEREKPEYRRKLDAGRQRRAKAEQLYAGDFEAAVLGFLRFDARHLSAARRMAKAVAAHAVPVGSGTVARTQRIPIERRAEAAAIAWMRHQTTAYDDMQIPRVKGMRREVRRMLAQRSRELLGAYREGRPVSEASCPLLQALARLPDDGPSPALGGGPGRERGVPVGPATAASAQRPAPRPSASFDGRRPVMR